MHTYTLCVCLVCVYACVCERLCLFCVSVQAGVVKIVYVIHIYVFTIHLQKCRLDNMHTYTHTQVDMSTKASIHTHIHTHAHTRTRTRTRTRRDRICT
jgi:hypothetical protein